MLLAFLQQHGATAAEAAQHGAEAAGQHGAAAAQTAEHVAEAGGAGGGEHVPALVEWVNHTLGHGMFSLQQQIMPPIYNLVGAHWPGQGKTFEQYMAEGHLPIPTHVVMFLIAATVAVIVLRILRGKLSTEAPTTRQQTFEVGVETVRSLLADLAGPNGAAHFPVIAAFATIILISNLMGMLPGLISPTANLNVTLALGLTSFIYYNAVGIKENGLVGHLKHFMGPMPAIAFLMFPIELISHSARILSLSLRLFGNIFGEEQVSGVIGGMLPWIVPMALYPLSLLAAFLQTFIFIVLSMIYIGEVSHHGDDHGHDEGHGAHGHAEAAAH